MQVNNAVVDLSVLLGSHQGHRVVMLVLCCGPSGSRISLTDKVQAVRQRMRNKTHSSCYKESSLILVFFSKTLEDTVGEIDR